MMALMVGMLDVVERAVLNAVLHATPAGGLPALGDDKV
jgi:hypothetical protein